MIDITFTSEEAELLRSALLLKLHTLDDMIYWYNSKGGPPKDLLVTHDRIMKLLMKVESANAKEER